MKNKAAEYLKTNKIWPNVSLYVILTGLSMAFDYLVYDNDKQILNDLADKCFRELNGE